MAIKSTCTCCGGRGCTEKEPQTWIQRITFPLYELCKKCQGSGYEVKRLYDYSGGTNRNQWGERPG